MGSMDEKAERVRSLLSSYYGTDDGGAAASGKGQAEPVQAQESPMFSSRAGGIDSAEFDVERYMAKLVKDTKLDGLLSKHVEMSQEVKTLDGDMQMLVYENYNKFISATDTIRRMKDNVSGMEARMEELLTTMAGISQKSQVVNTTLFDRRNKIEELNSIRGLLNKLQVVFDLPQRITAAAQRQQFDVAIRLYLGAQPLFKKYGTSSFASAKSDAEDAISGVRARLKELMTSPSTSAQEAASFVSLLKDLREPMEAMQGEFLVSRCKSLTRRLGAAAQRAQAAGLLTAESGSLTRELAAGIKDARGHEDSYGTVLPGNDSNVSVGQFVTDVNQGFLSEYMTMATAYADLFPNAPKRLTEHTRELFAHFYFALLRGVLTAPGRLYSAHELAIGLEGAWATANRVHGVVPKAALTDRAAELLDHVVRYHIRAHFAQIETRVASAIQSARTTLPSDAPTSRQAAMSDPGPAPPRPSSASSGTPPPSPGSGTPPIDPNSSTGRLLRGQLRGLYENLCVLFVKGIDEVVKELAILLSEKTKCLGNERDTYIDLVHAHFQQLFTSLIATFSDTCQLLPATVPQSTPNSPNSPFTSSTPFTSAQAPGSKQADAASAAGSQSMPPLPAGLILLLARVCLYLELSSVPHVMESLAHAFSGGGQRGAGHAPPFVAGEMMRALRTAGEKLLSHYVAAQGRKLDMLVQKSITGVDWLQAQEPQEASPVVDQLLNLLHTAEAEALQLLDEGQRPSLARSGSAGAIAGGLPPGPRHARGSSFGRMSNLGNSSAGAASGLERDVARLFTQKAVVFQSKLEFTQVSVLSGLIRVALKSYIECVRLETLSTGGCHQIELNTHVLREPLRRFVDDETVVDNMLEELCHAAGERCIKPTPLDPAIVEKMLVAHRPRAKSLGVHGRMHSVS
eukprot:jgi/Chlat1/4701/Chrsp3S05649